MNTKIKDRQLLVKELVNELSVNKMCGQTTSLMIRPKFFYSATHSVVWTSTVTHCCLYTSILDCLSLSSCVTTYTKANFHFIMPGLTSHTMKSCETKLLHAHIFVNSTFWKAVLSVNHDSVMLLF